MKKDKKGLPNRLGLFAFVLISVISAITLVIGLGTKVFKTNTTNRTNYGDPTRVPGHEKTLVGNGDGTYKLSLTVTGDSEKKETNTKANVIIVLDTSGSMNFPADESNPTSVGNNNNTGAIGRYYRTGSDNNYNYWRLFYRNNGVYYEEGTGPEANVRHSETETYYIYSSNADGSPSYRSLKETHPNSNTNVNRYNFTNNDTRLEQTRRGVKDLTSTLLAQNTNTEDMVEISLITFAKGGHFNTPSSASATGWISGTDTSTIDNAIDNITASGSTNWDEALYMAKQLADAKNDGDKTYIVFFSDGEPTQHDYSGRNDGTHTADSHSHGSNQTGGGSTSTPNDRGAAYYEAKRFATEDYDLYGIFAYGETVGQGYMRSLVSYGNFGDNNHTGSDIEGKTYFSANNQDEIDAAFNAIASSISDAVGIANVEIEDGTTTGIKAQSGNLPKEGLLDIDQNSYEYWMTFPVTKDGSVYKYTAFNNYQGIGEKTFTFSISGTTVTVSWDDKSAQYELGELAEDESYIKIKWDNTAATDFYYAAPTAEFTETASETEGDQVTWDLKNMGALLNGVTYEVTFDVWPSQTALDLIADAKNAGGYDKLPAEVKPYFDENFNLKTNTGAVLTYDDTKYGEIGNTSEYTDPEPVETDTSKTMTVTKTWSDDDHADAINLGVNRDTTENYYPVQLNKDNNWTQSVVISIGILSVDKNNGTVIERTTGHDYSFSEPKELAYNWELSAPTVHPMSINGKLTMLYKEDAAPAGMGSAKYYKAEDGTEYYKIGESYYRADEDVDAASLTADNTRKSYLDIKKVVTGTDADPDQIFELSVDMNTNNTKEKEIWFSIWDSNKGGLIINNSSETFVQGMTTSNLETFIDGEDGYEYNDDYNSATGILSYTKTENGESETTKVYVGPNYTVVDTEIPTGYYVAANPVSNLKFNVKTSYNVRFLNIPTKSTYTVKETNDGGADYVLTSVESKIDGEANDDDEDLADATIGEVTVSTGNTHHEAIFTNDYQRTHVYVEKEWEDNDNQDAIRPSTITVNLLANGKTAKDDEGNEVEPVEITPDENGKWSYTFENLAKYDENDNEITYTVVEDTIEGYTANTTDIREKNEDGTYKIPDIFEYKITNTHTPAVVNKTVVKVWADDDDRDSLRPDSITMTLQADGVNVPSVDEEGNVVTDEEGNVVPVTVTLTEVNNWTQTVTGLPQYKNVNNEQVEIAYTWVEPEVSGYTPSDPVVNGNTVTITNTHEIATKSATVTKVWDDDSNRDGVRPTSIVMTLYDDKNQVVTFKDATGANTSTVTLTEASNWTATVNGLPANRKNTTTDASEPITYHWTEDTTKLPTGYSKSAEATTPSETNDSTRITNSYEYEKTSRKITKVWSDDENRDGKRPTTLVVTLSNYGDVTLNADNEWTATIEDLPVHRNNNGTIETIEYTWSEDESKLPEGYSLTGNTSTTTETGIETTFTNSYTPEKTSRKITKVWSDDENRDGLRPTTLVVTLSNYGDVTLTAANNWTATIEDLPVHRNNEGKIETIEYTWSEDESKLPEGYTLTDTTNTTTEAGIETTITNSHDIATKQTIVTKTWDDDSNRDGVRPTTIVMTLYDDKNQVVTFTDKNGNETSTVTLTGTGNDWTETVTGLPKNRLNTTTGRAEEISYHWVEDESSLPTGYSKKSENTTNDETTIVNTYAYETTSRKITKVWNDNNNQDGVRPDTLVVTLSNYGDVTLTAEDKWTATISNLPVHRNNNGTIETIEYVWSEDESKLPEGYKLTKTEISEDRKETTLYNSYNPETTTSTIIKAWEDDSNRDGIRPDTLVVTLSNYGDVTLTAEDKWTATIEDLPVHRNNNGKIETIEYKWSEKNVPAGYKITNTSTSGTVTTIENTHEVKLTSITATKVWADNDNQDGLQPEKVTIELVANGVGTGVYKEATGPNWKVTFENLKENENGTAINYSVKENPVPTGYTEEVTGTMASGFTITNTHTPETTEVSFTKVWVDGSNHDGMRPETLPLTLKADGKAVSATPTITKDGDTWTITYTGLPKFAGTKTPIVYTIEEGEVANYQGKVEGSTITNTHTPEKVSVEVVKEWHDNSNQDGIRPENVTFTLYADGVEQQDYTFSAEGNVWKYTIPGLDKYKNVDGQPHEIVYTVDEKSVPTGYTKTKTNDLTITNTHDPAKRTITGTKSWKDDDDRDGIRPETITINLLANGEPATYSDGTKVEPATATAEGGWTYKFENLPQYKDGVAIQYSVKEDIVTGYNSKVTINGDIIDIENTHEIEKVTISGTKVWDDADDQDGKRPGSITIKLMVGEEAIQSTNTTADEGWEWSFTDLPKNENGKPIEYSIVEVQVENYDEPKVEKVPEKDYEYTVTNTHTPEKVSYTVIKSWEDDDDRDGIRPQSITIHLLANGKEKESKTLNGVDDDWSWTIEDLPRYEKGKEITYSFKEDAVEGYEANVITTTENPTSVTIVNTHTPEETELEITKTWEEDQFYLDRRPDMITVDIYADGVYLDTIKVYKDDNWTAKVTNLYKYSKGVKIEYTIKEKEVDGYVSVVSGSQESGYEITNTFVDGEGCTDCEEPPHTRIDITFDNNEEYYTFVTLLVGAVALSASRKFEM